MIKIKDIEERIERYQHERNEQFARWNNYEISRESARKAIGTLTRWIEKLGVWEGAKNRAI